MFESLYVYGLLGLLMISFGYVEARNWQAVPQGQRIRKRRRFWEAANLIPILLFAIVFGSRYMVGVDYLHYLDFYLHGGRDFEFGFQSLLDLMSGAGMHYAWFFGLWALIQVSLLYYAFRYERYLFPWFAFFLIFGSGYVSWMNIIRHQLAACIFLMSIECIEKKQPLKYYLWVLLAFLFHKSSILLIVVYPLIRWRKDWFVRRWVQFILLGIAVFLGRHYDWVIRFVEQPFLLFTSVAGFDNYALGILQNSLDDRTKFGQNTGFGLYAKLLKAIPVIYYSTLMKRYYRSDRFKIFYSFWFVALLTSIALESSIVLYRPFVFVTNFNAIIMPAYFLNFCFKRRNKVRLVIAVLYLALTLLLFLNIVMHGEQNYTAFHFFWENHLTDAYGY